MSEADPIKTVVDLDEETNQRLQRLVAKRGQPAGQIALDAVRHYLDWIDGLDEFDRAAVESWVEYKKTGLHITAEEADAWLAQLEAGNDVEPPECHA